MHQCVHCGKLIESGSRELLEGCGECGGHFFFYIKDEQLQQIKEQPIEIPAEDKIKIEKDVREMAGIQEDTAPVILDLESIRVMGEGKFQLDIVNIFNRKRPLIYKLEEGKYIIDLASTLQKDMREIKEIREPD